VIITFPANNSFLSLAVTDDVGGAEVRVMTRPPPLALPLRADVFQRAYAHSAGAAIPPFAHAACAFHLFEDGLLSALSISSILVMRSFLSSCGSSAARSGSRLRLCAVITPAPHHGSALFDVRIVAIRLIDLAVNHMIELALDQVLGESVGAAPVYECGSETVYVDL
jgi:hypothetical protein